MNKHRLKSPESWFFSHVSWQFVLFGLVMCCQAAQSIRPDVERQLRELCAEVSPKLRGVRQLVQVPLLQIYLAVEDVHSQSAMGAKC